MRLKTPNPAWGSPDLRSDSDAGGKTQQAKFPGPRLPLPLLATFTNKNYPKKKYIIQSAEASEKLIVAPIPIRGKAGGGGGCVAAE